ncbi:MAG: M48 family metallopeptidase [Balneolaceae bacterium]
MNSPLRDFLILVLIAAGLFAAIYIWISARSDTTEDRSPEEASIFSTDFKLRLADSFEEQLTFIENDYTREFEEVIRQRFTPFLKGDSGVMEIRIVQGNQVNAFTTVGDRIYLYRGLITDVDDMHMIAAIIAHELGHIHHRHVEERLKVDLGTSLIMSILTGGNQGMILELSRTMMNLTFSRAQENEADEFAIHLLEQADLHPQYLSQAFLRMKTLSSRSDIVPFLSTHPSLEERIKRIMEHEIKEDFEERRLQFSWQEFIRSLNE